MYTHRLGDSRGNPPRSALLVQCVATVHVSMNYASASKAPVHLKLLPGWIRGLSHSLLHSAVTVLCLLSPPGGTNGPACVMRCSRQHSNCRAIPLALIHLCSVCRIKVKLVASPWGIVVAPAQNRTQVLDSTSSGHCMSRIPQSVGKNVV